MSGRASKREMDRWYKRCGGPWRVEGIKHNYAVTVNGVLAFRMLARSITEVANALRGSLNVRVFKCTH